MVSKKPQEKKTKVLSFQETILNLQRYWSKQGCIILQPYDLEVGAGTFHPATTLKVTWQQTMENCICATIKKTNRW